MPYFAPGVNFKTQHMIALIALTGLGAGLLVMLSLLSQNLRFTSIGIILCLAGYANSIYAAAQEWRMTVPPRA